MKNQEKTPEKTPKKTQKHIFFVSHKIKPPTVNLYCMEQNTTVIEDVQASLMLARSLHHRPLINSILESCSQALDTLLCQENSPVELPSSESEQEETTSSKRGGTKYNNFVSDINQNLRSLYPERSQQQRIADAAKLWQTHKHLGDPDAILSAARRQLKNDLPVPTFRSLTIESTDTS